MTFVSKAALAAVLGATVAFAPAPADAQRRKEEKPPQVQVSEAFRTAAIAGEQAVTAGNIAEAERQLAAADAAATNDDERFFAANLRLSVADKKKDKAMLATALDQLIAHPKTPADRKALFNHNRGILALEQKQPDAAMRYFQAAKAGGFNDPDYDVRVASIEVGRGNTDAGLAALDRAVQARKASGQPVPANWYKLAIANLYKTKPQAAADWVRRLLSEYPTQENWRTALVLFRDRTDTGNAQLSNQVRLDVFRLMREAKVLADQNDYREYAYVTSELGLPYETVAVIDEGRSNGKIPASATVFTQAKSQAQTSIKAEGSLASSETRSRSAANGKVAAATANAYLASGNPAKAVELLQLALQKGGVDADEVNTRLGIALARAGRTDEARQAFAQVKTGPRAELAAFWTQYLTSPRPAAASTAPATTGA